MIQTAGGQQWVVSHQLRVRGEQQLLTFLHAQILADGCLDEAADHAIGFNEVLIAGQHVEIEGR